MSLIDPTIPANSEPVNLGAQRIRETRQIIDETLGQMFNDDASFKTNFVTQPMLAGDNSVSANRAVASINIQDEAVGTNALANGALSADSNGRLKMADGYLTPAKLAPGFTAPPGSVDTDSLLDGVLSADTNGRNKMAAGYLTPALAGTGVAKIAIGTYAGSNSAAAVVSGLAFAPDVVIFSGGPNIHNIGIAFLQEASGGPAIGDIHATWATGAIGAPLNNAIQWNSDGFTVITSNMAFNNGGITHSYIAIKL